MEVSTFRPNQEITNSDSDQLNGATHNPNTDLTPQGLEYWSKSTPTILTTSAEVAYDMRTGLSEGQQLPAWANSVLRDFGRLTMQADAFTKQLKADTARLLEGQNIEGQRTLTASVNRWYRSLGPTNDSEDVAPLILSMVDILSSEPNSPERDILTANMLEDAALRTGEPEKRITLLIQARELFNKLSRGDLSNPDVRLSLRQRIDCDHQIISMKHAAGEIDDNTFQKYYTRLQTESIRTLSDAINKEHSTLGDGEMLEWASQIFIRHHYWTQGTAEVNDVRSALLREDQAIYPWQIANGQNPIWSFDTVVQHQQTPNDATRIQFKAGSFSSRSERYRSYLPTMVNVVVAKPEEGIPIRLLVKNGIQAIQSTYDFTNSRISPDHKIDESGIKSFDALLTSVL